MDETESSGKNSFARKSLYLIRRSSTPWEKLHLVATVNRLAVEKGIGKGHLCLLLLFIRLPINTNNRQSINYNFNRASRYRYIYIHLTVYTASGQKIIHSSQTVRY